MAGISCGLVGLPNVGKSTLFNAITNAGVEAANYPFCTIDPNVGVVKVPDSRVDRLCEIEEPDKKIYATIEFVDIAGLVKGASKGEGKGNQFLEHIHHVDLIVHVVRCFDNDQVVHVDGAVDPVRDIETINLELILADLDYCDRAIKRLSKKARSGDKQVAKTCEVLTRVSEHLGQEKSARSLELSDEDKIAVRDYRFLTSKNIIYAANVGDDDLPDMDNDHVKGVRTLAGKSGDLVVPISALIEEEVAQLDKVDAKEFLVELGLKESGLDRLIRTSYSSLGLMTFLTSGKQEVRAWTIHKGTKGPKAAAVIHTDFEKGYIRAEIIPFEAIDKYGGKKGAREAGLLRIEGKDYIMQDGDVTEFRVST
ncbi:redox-regulated ATPase YchF [PVC group bacterium]|nr:redox-regulated ATPase YchF [PVC group bacterium]